jgi:hypothetical protein
LDTDILLSWLGHQARRPQQGDVLVFNHSGTY